MEVNTEPTTEAGRRWLADEYGADVPAEAALAILAIEAEARADALREAAERVRANAQARGDGDDWISVTRAVWCILPFDPDRPADKLDPEAAP